MDVNDTQSRILVTGGSGLLGTELINQLVAQGKMVTAIYHSTPLPAFPAAQVRQFHCDILDVISLEAAMEGIEVVFHCAGMVSFDPSRKKELFKVNVEGTANVVNAAIDSGVKKFIHVSSVAALGRIRDSTPITEHMNWSEETSNSTYGQTKYLGELEVWRGAGEGLEAIVVNPVIILGAGDWNASSSQLFKTVYDEFPWYSDGTTGFVDVRDVASIMIQLMQTGTSNQRFIISAANKSYGEIFNLIAKGFGKKPPYKKVTPFIASIVWRLEALKKLFTGKNPLVTKETAATALSKVNFDNSKLYKFLPGFTYRPLEETIAHTCNILQQKLNNS